MDRCPPSVFRCPSRWKAVRAALCHGLIFQWICHDLPVLHLVCSQDSFSAWVKKEHNAEQFPSDSTKKHRTTEWHLVLPCTSTQGASAREFPNCIGLSKFPLLQLLAEFSVLIEEPIGSVIFYLFRYLVKFVQFILQCPQTLKGPAKPTLQTQCQWPTVRLRAIESLLNGLPMCNLVAEFGIGIPWGISEWISGSTTATQTFMIWRFPEIGVPPVIIHFNRIFHHKPIIFGYPHLWNPPYGLPHIRDWGPSWL